jgi:hypothetical protein
MRGRIKNMNWFALISILFLGVIMTLPAMNVAFGVDYIEMPELVLLTIFAVITYVAYLRYAVSFKMKKR